MLPGSLMDMVVWPSSGGNHLIQKLPSFSNHRVMGIQLTAKYCNLCLLSTYLPTRSGCTDQFKETLDYLDSILSQVGLDHDTMILGDLNADTGPSGGPHCTTSANEQGQFLQRYLLNWNHISAHLNTPQPPPCSSHTFISEAHGYLTTIDHILCPQHLLPQIVKCHPLNEDPLNTSDHLPLICHLNLDLHSHLSPKTNPISHPKPNWKKVSTQEIHDTYTKAVEAALGPIPLPTLSALSSNPLEIDFHLDQLTSVLTPIALSTIPTSKPSPHKGPGWSDHLNAAHRESKNAYKIWRAAGRPRNPNHPACMQYKEAKRNSD